MIDGKFFWLLLTVIPASACLLVGLTYYVSVKLEEKAKKRKLAEKPVSDEDSITVNIKLIENSILRLKEISKQAKYQNEEFEVLNRQLNNESGRSYIK